MQEQAAEPTIAAFSSLEWPTKHTKCAVSTSIVKKPQVCSSSSGRMSVTSRQHAKRIGGGVPASASDAVQHQELEQNRGDEFQLPMAKGGEKASHQLGLEVCISMY